jgi:hypothetical protein
MALVMMKKTLFAELHHIAVKLLVNEDLHLDEHCHTQIQGGV